MKISIFKLITSILATIILLWVDWRIFLAIFLLKWGENYLDFKKRNEFIENLRKINSQSQEEKEKI